MSLVTIDADAAEPPYEQVRRQVAEGASNGTLKPGHKLPPVRQLAADLGLAVNTVAKAYKALEADGVIETHGRGGTLIATRRIGDAEATQAAETYVRIARRQGLSLDETKRLIDQNWS